MAGLAFVVTMTIFIGITAVDIYKEKGEILMSKFDYSLDFTETVQVADSVTKLYQYKILYEEDQNLGYIRVKHSLDENEVVATLRVHHLEGYSASGTARRMLEDLLYRVINHDTKATFMFDIDDMHTVALLSLNDIDKNLVIEG